MSLSKLAKGVPINNYNICSPDKYAFNLAGNLLSHWCVMLPLKMCWLFIITPLLFIKSNNIDERAEDQMQRQCDDINRQIWVYDINFPVIYKIQIGWSHGPPSCLFLAMYWTAMLGITMSYGALWPCFCIRWRDSSNLVTCFWKLNRSGGRDRAQVHQRREQTGLFSCQPAGIRLKGKAWG